MVDTGQQDKRCEFLLVESDVNGLIPSEEKAVVEQLLAIMERLAYDKKVRICGEIILREEGAWRLRIVFQGWEAGLAYEIVKSFFDAHDQLHRYLASGAFPSLGRGENGMHIDVSAITASPNWQDFLQQAQLDAAEAYFLQHGLNG